MGVVAVSAALGAAMLAPASAEAQERYRLTDDGWQQTQTHLPDSPEGRLQAISKLVAEGKADQARKAAERWIREHPNHPLLVEAHLLRGDAWSAKGRYYRALFDYELIIRAYPASEQFHTALQREFEIARLYVNGIKRHFLGMRILPADGEGVELLIRIQERAPGTELGERAMLTLADFYFRTGNMGLAADAYDLFLQNYPRTVNREWAMLRLIQASLARFRGPQFDATGLIEASQRLRMYRDEFPAASERLGTDALLVRIDESLALKELHTANWYEVRQLPVSAAYIYRRVVDDYPQTAAAQVALDRLAALDVDPTRLPGRSQE